MVVFWIKTFLAGIALAIAESTFLNAVEIHGVRPDLAVLAVVAFIGHYGFQRAIAVAFLLGLTRDLFSVGPLGISAFSLTLMAYLLILAERYLMTDHKAAQVFFTFVGAVLFGISLTTVRGILSRHGVGTFAQTMQFILWISVYTAMLAPAAFVLLGRAGGPSYVRMKMKYGADSEAVSETEV
jgi:rod shape-determining protein MreD